MMRYYALLAAFVGVAIFATTLSYGAVKVRHHRRVLEVPLVEVLDALGLTAERANKPRFRIEGDNLTITVDGAG
jgi:hypothetical protein